MEHTRTDSAPRSVTLTAFDFAMEEVTAASSRLATALSARPKKRADAATIEQECADARSVYERMLHLYPGCGSTTRSAPHFSRSWGSSGRA